MSDVIANASALHTLTRLGRKLQSSLRRHTHIWYAAASSVSIIATVILITLGGWAVRAHPGSWIEYVGMFGGMSAMVTLVVMVAINDYAWYSPASALSVLGLIFTYAGCFFSGGLYAGGQEIGGWVTTGIVGVILLVTSTILTYGEYRDDIAC